MNSLAGVDPIGILLYWVFVILGAVLIPVAVIGLGGFIGAVMPRLIVKCPSNIETVIGCVFGAVAGAIFAIAYLFFYLTYFDVL